MLNSRDRISLKKQYIAILKEHIYSSRGHTHKSKEIISDMRCEILKPFYKRQGTVVLTSNEIIYFDDLSDSNNATDKGDNIFFF